MKFINVVGLLEKFDEFNLKYIINNNIQIESAIDSVEEKEGLKTFIEENVYDDLAKRTIDANAALKGKLLSMETKEIENLIASDSKEQFNTFNNYVQIIEKKVSEYKMNLEHIEMEIDDREKIKKQILLLMELDTEVDKFFNFDYFKFRFGKISNENYKKLNSFVDDLDVIAVPIHVDKKNMWISYFMPAIYKEKVDSVFSSLNFERIRISGRVKGTPQEALNQMNDEIDRLHKEKERLIREYDKYFKEQLPEFEKKYAQIMYMNRSYDIRKKSAHTEKAFYFVGWVPENDFESLAQMLDNEIYISYVSEEPEDVIGSEPPTMLKNAKFFKPFEFFINMYGLPAHNEIDPTMIIASIYILMFGVMFGDVGQGFIIAILAAVIYKKKGIELAGIVTYAGISSVIFGFIYGSVFGNEEIIKPLLISPMHNIYTMLFLAVGFGVVMILLSIALNIINGFRTHNIGRIVFDKNGLVGLVFYGGIIGTVLYFVTKGKMITSVLLIIGVFVLPLVILLFREPLENIIEKREKIMPDDIGTYLVEGFFELVETVLGFLSNTISFVRVGAFALNHAGLSLAIWTLVNMTKGVSSIAILIIGNIFVIALEGLIVGIQCLRLQYYEIFSRFFGGEGKEFNPVRLENKI